MFDILLTYFKLVFSEVWSLCLMMSPYLLLGMLVSSLISMFINSRFILKHIGGKDFLSVFKSTVFGVPIPLCSCGVIPVAATLRDAGASKGSTISFLVSTPQTGVDSIFLTYGMLGPVFALFRPMAAFISGLFSGLIINRLDEEKHDHPIADIHANLKQESFSERLKKGAKYGFYTLPADIVAPLFQGIIVAAIIAVFIPPDFIAQYFSSDSPVMLFMMLLVSLPVYVCATASVPIGLALMSKGISAGAVFVFLMAGPATNAASINVVKNILGKKTMYYYLGLISSTAILFGFILDSFFSIIPPIMSAHEHDHSMDGNGTLILTVAFLLILANSYFFSFISNGKEVDKKTSSNFKKEFSILVQGMTCSHCKESVESAVLSCNGVEDISVDLATGDVIVSGNNFDESLIKEKIINRGFSVNI
jgi:uncharacterized membrane protein YraQ (UPF0718 family)/copper chaperone CopZ